MQTDAYLELFYPLDELDLIKRCAESAWNINEDRMMIAPAMTFSDQPVAMRMCFQRQYAERYNWLVPQFKDWAFYVTNLFFYYLDYDRMGEAQRNTMRMGMAAFGGNAPTYPPFFWAGVLHRFYMDFACPKWTWCPLLPIMRREAG